MLSIARGDPLPHQLEAVYKYFLRLPRIRFLLADDPGAGKTIMADLLLKELKARGLVGRTLIVTPANLTFQWQRELKDKFRENFEVVNSDVLRANYGQNPWQERNLKGCKCAHWSDLQASKVQVVIANLRSSMTQSATAQTRNAYLRDFKRFCRWSVSDGRLSHSPVEYLRPLSAAKVRNDVRHERRALTLEEAIRLLAATRAHGDRYGMPGAERALLYQLAIETGLRAAEMNEVLPMRWARIRGV